MSRPAPLDDTYCVCELCQLSPSIDRGMVACDECGKWFHYSCANVDDSIQDQPWCCKLCLAMRSQRHRGTSTVSSRRKKAKELELKRLDEEYAMQQEYMRRRYDVMASYIDESDDDEEESAQSSKLSNVSRTRQWIDRQIEVKGGPKAFETYGVQAIPVAGPSHVGLQGACFPVTPAGRPDSRVLPRQHQIPPAAVAHDRQQAHHVPSLPELQPPGSVMNSYGLGMVSSVARSQGSLDNRDHRVSSFAPAGVATFRNTAEPRVANPVNMNANFDRNERQWQSASVAPSMLGEFPVCGPSPAQIAARQVRIHANERCSHSNRHFPNALKRFKTFPNAWQPSCGWRVASVLVTLRFVTHVTFGASP
nr:uncharacterized protein LOC115266180 [Aedes albopictus]